MCRCASSLERSIYGICTFAYLHICTLISYLCTFMSDEIKKRSIFDFGLLKRVFRYAAPYKTRLYISITLSVLLAVISPLRPFLIQVTVNDYIKNGVVGDLILKNKMVELVIWLTILQIVLLLVETAFRFYFSFITAWLGQTV